MTSAAERPVIAIVASETEYRALASARASLRQAVDAFSLVNIHHAPPAGDPAAQRERLLQSQSPPIIGVLDGGLDRPRLTGRLRPGSSAVGQLKLMIEHARLLQTGAVPAPADITLVHSGRHAGSLAPARALTARAGQALLFLLTLLLSTMLLSQLIDEKSNKIIEVLAAAVPIEAIFLGKLFAMLGISLLGIAVWTSVGATAIAALATQGLGVLAPPAVGWPAFLALSLVYFAMAYLLLGAVFLGIGAQASSAREVQTLSMPVTMVQVLIFAIAATAIGDPDGPKGLFAAAFPLSSPYAMLARAAEQPDLWPHLLAILWQSLWVGLILAVGARIFRRSVLKSGPSRPFWRRARA